MTEEPSPEICTRNSYGYGKVASPARKTPVKDSMGSSAGILHPQKKNVKQIREPTGYQNLSSKDSLDNEGSGECVAWLSNTPSVGITGNSSRYENVTSIVCKTPSEGSTGRGTCILHREMKPNVARTLHMTPSEGSKSNTRGKGVPHANQKETNTEDMKEWDGYVFMSSAFCIVPIEDSITGRTVYNFKFEKEAIWTFFAAENVTWTLHTSITGNIFGSGGNVSQSAQKKPLSNDFQKSGLKKPLDKSVGYRNPGKTPLSSSLCKAKCDDSIKSTGSRASASHPHKKPWDDSFRKSVEDKNSLCSLFRAENKIDIITESEICVSNKPMKKAWQDLPGAIKGYKHVFPVGITSSQKNKAVKNPDGADYSSCEFSADIWSKTSQERRRVSTKSTVFDAPGPIKPPPPRKPERDPIMMVGYTQRRAPRPPAERHFRNVLTGEYVGGYVEKPHPHVHKYIPPKRYFPRKDNL